ncbi:MAG TPA: helix-turn-helix domain-containing protein, partial [Sphingomicrobium sp.]|nr:helix-turn-helix domain-containing protein [Sphingomicrobium sp.]
MPSIGPYVRDHVLPAGTTVSAAAKRLGVGRPTLSNLLNGNASLSRDMALKLEREFGADAIDLIRRQAQIENDAKEAIARKTEERVNAAGYLKITSTDIAHWAGTIPARTQFPVLMRRLVHSDAPSDAKIDFPGYDDGERPGWDGIVESDRSGHWVPEGRSGWELGTTKDPSGKANHDLRERAKLSAKERKATAFAFVTAQKWSRKAEWAAEQRAAGNWRDIRAYDALDIEQWLEQSATTQVWFLEQLGRQAEGVRTIDDCWREWADSTTPPLSPLLFADALLRYRQILLNWLEDPCERPFVVVADSTAEALAFVAVALKDDKGTPSHFHDAAIVAETPAALRKIAPASSEAVLVVAEAQTEIAASSLAKTHRIIIVRPRTSLENDPDVDLVAPSPESFNKALADMGIPEDERDRLQDESGLSPTILRRRRAKAPALRSPAWSSDPDLLRKLLPMLLAGAWNRTNDADKMLVSDLAHGKSYEEIEVDLTQLLSLPDTPVWAIGNYRGLISRKDALFAAGPPLTVQDLDRFFEVAEVILSEDDPALDLPPEDRWSANIYGKKRDVSGALRSAVGELLVLLAVYGDQILGAHLRPVARRVDILVAKLLRGVQARNWLAQRDDLPMLAEASPRTFLDAVEADLRSDNPQILAMLRPVRSATFDNPDRTGLLWALETVAWEPDFYLWVGRILARLSAVPIDDNWTNKPENSLQSLVRSWFPQTSVGIDERLKLIDILVDEFPDVGWRICSAQIDPGHRFATHNSKPRWRPVDTSATRPFDDEIYRANRYALDTLLNWKSPSGQQLGDLIQISAELPDADQAKLWTRVEQWIDEGATDTERADLRERMRRSVLSRRSQKRTKSGKLERRRRQIFEKLRPNDLIERHRWLFADHWVSESGDEIFDDNFDYDAHQKRILDLRQAAIAEIMDAPGLTGLDRLLAVSNARGTIGQCLAIATAETDRSPLAAELLKRAAGGEGQASLHCLDGFLSTLGPDVRQGVVEKLLPGLDDDAAITLFKACPFGTMTWEALETLRPDLAERYWREVVPWGWHHSDAELNLIVNRLLAAGRPVAAFLSVNHVFKRLDGKTLLRLLQALIRPTDEKIEQRIDGHSISAALEGLQATGAATVEEMAQLEYLFIDALDHSQYGIPNLERQIAKNPGDFVHLVSVLFKRDDLADDPPEMRPPDGVDLKAIGTQVFTALRRIRRTPGTRDDGSIDAQELLGWLNEARQQLGAIGRAGVG